MLVTITISKGEKRKNIALVSAVSLFMVVIILFWGINFNKGLASANDEPSLLNNFEESSNGIYEVIYTFKKDYEKIKDNQEIIVPEL
ncbi:hypothetical protein ISS03_00260 [Patescibacteria group bacterium]|nr:hypothetical protein [Patescibacteria group bacterium]